VGGFKRSGGHAVRVVGCFVKQEILWADTTVVGAMYLTERASDRMVIHCVHGRNNLCVAAGEVVFLFPK